MSYRIRLLTGLAGTAAVTSLLLGAGAPAMAAGERAAGGAVHAQTVLGPYASFEVCAVSGLQGQQAHQWISWFCSQNGTTQWWLFTTP